MNTLTKVNYSCRRDKCWKRNIPNQKELVQIVFFQDIADPNPAVRSTAVTAICRYFDCQCHPFWLSMSSNKDRFHEMTLEFNFHATTQFWTYNHFFSLPVLLPHATAAISTGWMVPPLQALVPNLLCSDSICNDSRQLEWVPPDNFSHLSLSLINNFLCSQVSGIPTQGWEFPLLQESAGWIQLLVLFKSFLKVDLVPSIAWYVRCSLCPCQIYL